MKRLLAAAIALGLLAGSATVAEAQDGREPQSFELRLEQTRAEQLEGREAAGMVLLGWGALNVVAGATVAVVGRDEPALLGGGVTAATWGLVNGLLSLFLLDLSGARARDIAEGRHGELTDPEAVREQAVVDQLRSGQIFALNFGLDVFYIGAGVLAFLLARAEDEDALAAAGLVSAGQGVFLLGFDLVEWLTANANAEALRAL